MTTKQELKIKIREVKVEERHLTIEERCMATISNALGCSKSFRDEVNTKLDSIGFVSNQCAQGLFRTETIRDATPDEYRAWAYLQLQKHCSCAERKTSSLDCHDCFLSGACIASDFKTANARFMFRGKEIILEVIE